MPNKFKLLKDLPGIKAGTEGFMNCGDILFQSEDGKVGQRFRPEFCEAHPDWFQPIPEKWPKEGDWYYMVHTRLLTGEVKVSQFLWAGYDEIHKRRIENNVVFRTEQQAQKAAEMVGEVLSGRLYEEIEKVCGVVTGEARINYLRDVRDKMKAFLE